MYAPSVPGPPSSLRLDLLGHVATFAALTFTGLLAGVPARWLLVGVAINAVASEVVQHWLLPDRSGDVTDLAADAVGIVLGWWAYRWWRLRERRMAERAVRERRRAHPADGA
ncbi:VanZ family protein [Serinibacter arcticus]|uniref:VanZ family protein n=1 Tax=Serinibacter arcticus TaxID=1655435 RepID=A0A2U2A084_9MICO|nr:VanZ family protein [Serinibacter arcticus]PWD52645.1 VanZ family protein [Serinibacter arcticus]